MITGREEWLRKAREQTKIHEWGQTRQYDHILQQGVQAGLSFDEYAKQTGCPDGLRERYLDLEDEHRLAEREKNDQFLKGFTGGGV